MKKHLLLFLIFFLAGGLVAQVSWSDDFESYSDGDLIGVVSDDWTTWSGAAGGADDTEVSSEEAFSGVNSLKLTSFQSGGGPVDIVLPFGEKFTSGGFTFKMMMYVAGETGAYFNFQAEERIGVTWAQETVFNPDGSLVVRSNGAQTIQGTFEHDKWFPVEWILDLDNNKWELIVDGQCLGFFENNWNAVASLNLYPVSDNDQSVYFVDDVSFSHDPNGLPDIQLDAGISAISIKNRALTGTELPVAGTLQNSGLDEITSFKVQFDDGQNTFDAEYTGLNIASGESYDFTTMETYTVAEGNSLVQMNLLEVNGQSDERSCNDNKMAPVQGVTPAPNKKVLVEEATGTWCTWCPRGDVFIRWMTRDYPDHFVPIAVHQGDPMANDHIDFVRAVTSGFTGYPNMLIDRKEWFGFGVVADVENRFFDQIVVPADASIDIGAAWDPVSRNLKVSTGLNFVGGNGGDYAVDVILIESNINKDSIGYQQTNAYAGGGRGPMGGYENLPSPVPAKDMIYNHVSRRTLTDYNGVPIEGYSQGERPVANFETRVYSGYNEEELYLVAVFSNADGTVNNVEEVSLQEAIDNGFEDATVSNEDVIALEGASLFPNPATNQTHVRINLEVSAPVQITVVNNIGQVVASRDYGQLQGEWVLPVDLGNMPSGMYEIMIHSGDNFRTKKLQVIK
jgi:hypothetical protein